MGNPLTVLKGFICHLQEHTLLRIHGLGLTRGDGEKRCIKVGNIAIDEVATFNARLDMVRFLRKIPRVGQPTVPFLSPLG